MSYFKTVNNEIRQKQEIVYYCEFFVDFLITKQTEENHVCQGLSKVFEFWIDSSCFKTVDWNFPIFDEN